MQYAPPLDNLIVTGRFRPPHRPTHSATDYRAAVGTPLYATISGTVKAGGSHPIAGGWVEIRGGGIMVGYNHMSRLTVRSGDRVKAGQLIGYSGNTGRSTAPHLHFYVEISGKRVDPDKWLGQVLHTGPFRDVDDKHQFAKDIAWMKETGITNGWSDGTFRPKDAVTREATAAFLYRLAGRPKVTLPKTSPFRDVKAGSQFYREIVWLSQSRITTGYADGTFRPKANIARDAMAAFLYRASGAVFTPPSKPTFKDVPKSAQFYREIEWLRSEGITTGYAGRKYKPYEPISREATAAFLHRYTH